MWAVISDALATMRLVLLARCVRSCLQASGVSGDLLSVASSASRFSNNADLAITSSFRQPDDLSARTHCRARSMGSAQTFRATLSRGSEWSGLSPFRVEQ